MDNFEQHNEITTSFSGNNIKNNEYYHFIEVDCNDKHKQLELTKEYNMYVDDKTNYRIKLEDGSGVSQSTPFSVTDILNNQTNYTYDRNEAWKCPERERRSYEYEQFYYQSQPYCPTEYFGQMYSNLPVHTNIESYWNQEMYHDHKIDEYYNYNPYCHNFYHQNYEQYTDAPPYHTVTEVPLKADQNDREMIHISVTPPTTDASGALDKTGYPEYVHNDSLEHVDSSSINAKAVHPHHTHDDNSSRINAKTIYPQYVDANSVKHTESIEYVVSSEKSTPLYRKISKFT